jgi:hypothetical protein
VCKFFCPRADVLKQLHIASSSGPKHILFLKTVEDDCIFRIAITELRTSMRTIREKNWIVNLKKMNSEFTFRPSKIPFENLITDMEYVTNQVKATQEVGTEVRQREVAILRKLKRQNRQ